MTQVVLTVSPACGIDARIAAFAAAALDTQSQEIAKAWGLTPIPVVLHDWDVLMKLTDGPELDAFTKDSWLMTVQPDIGVPGADGFHDDVQGVIFARCLPGRSSTDWTTPSHELAETIVDSTADQYRPMPDGKQIALESADPVEGDSYLETASIGPDSMAIELSNYVTPAYFDPNGTAPFDRMHRLNAPFTMTPGGYMVVADSDGTMSDVFARVISGGPHAHSAIAEKLENPRGRLMRRLRAVRL